MENTTDIHLNPASQTPPVDCPLLIEMPDGKLLRVERRDWARSHSEQLVFYTTCGRQITGKFRWTYP